MPPFPPLNRQAIIALCKDNDSKFSHAEFRQVILKSSSPTHNQVPRSLYNAVPLRYIYSKVSAHSSSPGFVDYVLHIAYKFVMEFIETVTHANNARELVVSALKWLRSVPFPPDAV